MTTQELITNAMLLPRHSRALLAELLLDTLEDAPGSEHEQEWIALAQKREEDLLSDHPNGVPHAEAMDSIRRQFGCLK